MAFHHSGEPNSAGLRRNSEILCFHGGVLHTAHCLLVIREVETFSHRMHVSEILESSGEISVWARLDRDRGAVWTKDGKVDLPKEGQS